MLGFAPFATLPFAAWRVPLVIGLLPLARRGVVAGERRRAVVLQESRVALAQ